MRDSDAMTRDVVDFSTHELEFFGREVYEPTIEETLIALSGGDFERFAARNDVIATLPGLLVALEWQGTQKQLIDALPIDIDNFDLTELGNTLARLGFRLSVSSASARKILPRQTPCLFMPNEGATTLALGDDEHSVAFFSAHGDKLTGTEVHDARGTVVRVRPIDLGLERRIEQSASSWVGRQLAPFRPVVFELLGLSLLTNLAALVMPLFVMTVYDRVINSESVLSLKYLVLGVAVLIVGDLLVRFARANALTYVSSRIGYIIGARVFNRTLAIGHAHLDRATTNAQYLRLKDADRIRGFIGSSMTTALLDLPFICIYLTAIGVLGGLVVLVPIAAIVVFSVAALVQSRKLSEQTRASSFGSMRRQELVMEAIEKMRSIRVIGGEDRWLQRFDEISHRVSQSNQESTQASQFVSNLGQTLSTFAALATISLGVGQVMAGEMSAGGLIASMMLVWRVLGPLQGAFVAATRWPQLKGAIAQVDNLMRLETESDGRLAIDAARPIEGRITFDKVTFRYGRRDPELAGVSFDVLPGEMLAVVGRNGAGKSTLLKLVAGLFHPQGGSVRIDGRDLRQYNPSQLREAMAYVSQKPELFEGSVRDCMRLVRPGATEEEIWEAFEAAGVSAAVEALPEGIDTVLSTHRQGSVSDSMMTRLTLARALLKRAPIVLLDEPVTGVDYEAEFAFVEALETLRHQATIVLVTHRPSHATLSDKVLVLHHGQPKYFGETSKVVDKMHTVM